MVLEIHGEVLVVSSDFYKVDQVLVKVLIKSEWYIIIFYKQRYDNSNSYSPDSKQYFSPHIYRMK